MAVIGMDLGGTKLSSAVFSEQGKVLTKSYVSIGKRKGAEVGELICEEVRQLMPTVSGDDPIRAVGVCVPGIYYARTGRVWAPNIPDWTDYPLYDELQTAVGSNVLVRVDSDRACAILGETWRGAARGCKDAIFLAIGTGIGAGILVDGKVLRGHQDIAGAIGWLALTQPFRDEYGKVGCFEYHGSGPGLAKVARDFVADMNGSESRLAARAPDQFTATDVFSAYAKGDPLAVRVIDNAVAYWGMAVANLVSLFNPQKIVFGGGVFGPAASQIDRIRAEAEKWAQPISITQVSLEISKLGGEAQMYGAARLALKARPVRSRRATTVV
jgi:glucokinase